MVLSDRVSVYNITDDFIFLWTLPRDKRGRGTITWFPTDISYTDFISKNEVNNVHNNAILVLLLKKYAKVQTQEVVPNVKDKPARVSKKTNTTKLPFKVEQTDCTWFTTYYTDVKIPVRGFMRWQACGVLYALQLEDDILLIAKDDILGRELQDIALINRIRASKKYALEKYKANYAPRT